MRELHAVAVRATVLFVVREHASPLDELETRLRREAERGRDADSPPRLLPAVTVEMAVFYRQHPDRN